MYQGFDSQAARQNFRRRIEERRQARLERWRQARAEAERAVSFIVETYHPRRVVQWGSVLRPELFTEVSDIDIAVEGVDDPERFSHMERDLLEMVSFPLDLIPLDRIHPEFRRDILETGRVVYEREADG